MQALFGNCSVAAVVQSLPLVPRTFAITAREVHALGTAPNTTESCAALSPKQDSNVVADSWNAGSTDGNATATVIDRRSEEEREGADAIEEQTYTQSLQSAGATRVPIVATRSRVLEYVVCADTMWNAPASILTAGSNDERTSFGGPSTTFIALTNPCGVFPARIVLNITAQSAQLSLSSDASG